MLHFEFAGRLRRPLDSGVTQQKMSTDSQLGAAKLTTLAAKALNVVAPGLRANNGSPSNENFFI